MNCILITLSWNILSSMAALATLYKYQSLRILLLAELAPVKALNYCNVLSDQPCNYTACHHTNHSTPVICWLQLVPPPAPHGTPTRLAQNHWGALNLRSYSAGQSRPLPVFPDLQGGGGDHKAPDNPELSRPPGDRTCTVKISRCCYYSERQVDSKMCML